MQVTTEFLKVPGGNNGGSWAARIKGVPLDDSEFVCQGKVKSLNEQKTELLSRTSFIFYAGMEGLGGIEMITDEDDTVSRILFSPQYAIQSHKGIEGPIKLSGSTPDLGEFVLRIVDGPGNNAVTSGIHADAFADRLEKTHFYGARVDPGTVWKARGEMLCY